MSCGRVRKKAGTGFTMLVEKELEQLQVAQLVLKDGESFSMDTGEREYGFVLISGSCQYGIDGDISGLLGPRENPYEHLPHALLVTREQRIVFTALEDTVVGVGSAPADRETANRHITPAMVGGGTRGTGNWQREVRFVIWTDNSEGSRLLMGETVVPSGNWSTIPPHRHQYDIPGEEVPYEEAYLFHFSKPQGFGLAWQFDDEGKLDQSFSLKANDILYMDRGYHPVVCGPGASLYQLTLMAGPHRTSMSRVHDHFKFLLNENGMENPYAKQTVK